MGARARAWLAARGLGEATLREWRIGFHAEEEFAEVEGVLNGLVTDGVVEAFTPATQGAGRPAIRYRVG